MIEVLDGFVTELRSIGVPVSLSEQIDAASALCAVSIADRQLTRAALAATLVKSPEHREVFERLFDLYFSTRGSTTDELVEQAELAIDSRSDGESKGRGPMDERGRLDPRAVADAVRDALRSADRGAIAGAARLAVALFARVEPGRPVGPSYYLHRTLRALDFDRMLADLLVEVRSGTLRDGDDPPGALGRTLRARELERAAEELTARLSDEIMRRLVEGRGARAASRGMRRPLVEDIDFAHASSADLAEMQRAIRPLARILASRLANKRRHRRRGHLDVRATIRRSLSSGGVPLEPRFKRPHPVRPEIFVLADVSGSVAAFARFTVHLVYAISEQFSKVRSAVFIDGVDEVTGLFARAHSIAEAVVQVSERAEVVDAYGHSNYGNALRMFSQRMGSTLTNRTVLLILGDARSNYHPGEPEVLRELRRKVRRIYWLNPEPRSYWGTGDSIIDEYLPWCDRVFECRTLRQLRAFVEELA